MRLALCEKSTTKSRDTGTLAGMTRKRIFCAVLTAAVLSVVLNVAGLAQAPAPAAQSEGAQSEKIYRVSDGFTAPKVTKNVFPEFSKEAKKKKVQGVVILSLVVGSDGVPRDIQVKQSLGHGLDEKAVEAVSQWRFEPGRKDGQPVPVSLSVEVNFHLYINPK